MELIKEVDRLIRSFLEQDTLLYRTFNQEYYDLHFSGWSSTQYYTLRNSFLHLVTGEPNYDEFYNKFDSPGGSDGTKPVAWDESFIPDRIGDAIMSNRTLEERINEVSALYRKCIKIERKYKEGK
jgi:hypothetical protein